MLFYYFNLEGPFFLLLPRRVYTSFFPLSLLGVGTGIGVSWGQMIFISFYGVGGRSADYLGTHCLAHKEANEAGNSNGFDGSEMGYTRHEEKRHDPT